MENEKQTHAGPTLLTLLLAVLAVIGIAMLIGAICVAIFVR